jgi:hypothetical protein
MTLLPELLVAILERLGPEELIAVASTSRSIRGFVVSHRVALCVALADADDEAHLFNTLRDWVTVRALSFFEIAAAEHCCGSDPSLNRALKAVCRRAQTATIACTISVNDEPLLVHDERSDWGKSADTITLPCRKFAVTLGTPAQTVPRAWIIQAVGRGGARPLLARVVDEHVGAAAMPIFWRRLFPSVGETVLQTRVTSVRTDDVRVFRTVRIRATRRLAGRPATGPRRPRLAPRANYR